MFGLEKKGKALFEFDLEKELKEQSRKNQKSFSKQLKDTSKRLKTLCGKARSEDFDKYGILLHGYAALQRVLTRIANKNKN